MWRVANSSKSCGWRWLPGQHASCSHGRSQGLPGLPHAPVGSPQRRPLPAGALEQRVAFSFPSCTGLLEGSGREELADSGPASGSGLFC